MALSYNLGYQEIISVHRTRRQIFAGKPSTILDFPQHLRMSHTLPALKGLFHMSKVIGIPNKS